MIFSDLYGTELDRVLSSADRTNLFTTARRKEATNAAQREWVKRTECFVKETTIPLVDDTQEYDLEASISDFGAISRRGVTVAIDNGTTTRYIEGDDLIETSIERLNQEEPGWRAVSAGAPRKYYVVRNGGAVNLGLHPKPSVGSGETWTALLPYVMFPADMSADADEPFTVSSNPIRSLRFWHDALPHWAAYLLEDYRKDDQRQQKHLALWEAKIVLFTGAEKPKGQRRVRLVRDYRRRSAPAGWRRDPRVV